MILHNDFKYIIEFNQKKERDENKLITIFEKLK